MMEDSVLFCRSQYVNTQESFHFFYFINKFQKARLRGWLMKKSGSLEASTCTKALGLSLHPYCRKYTLKEYTDQACFERIRMLERKKKRDTAPNSIFGTIFSLGEWGRTKGRRRPYSVLHIPPQFLSLSISRTIGPNEAVKKPSNKIQTRVATVVGQVQNPERKPKGAILFL